jgi:hypothetical protein
LEQFLEALPQKNPVAAKGASKAAPTAPPVPKSRPAGAAAPPPAQDKPAPAAPP